MVNLSPEISGSPSSEKKYPATCEAREKEGFYNVQSRQRI
jgi:hypothetical protein